MTQWTAFLGQPVVRSNIYVESGNKCVGQATSKEAEEAIIRLLRLCEGNFATELIGPDNNWVGGERWETSAWW